MNLFQHFRGAVVEIVRALAAEGLLAAELDCARVAVEPAREAHLGDVATNAALVLAGAAGIKPRALAALIKERLERLGEVAAADIAGPGFINLRLADSFWHARLTEILEAGTAYGDSFVGGGEPVNVEYVSANPTGPLHVGHGRGAVVGDALAALLEKAGYKVTREYYINDAGAQVDALARSLFGRYKAQAAEGNQGAFRALLDVGAIQYRGEYLISTATDIASRQGSQWVTKPESEWLPEFRQRAIDDMMKLIRNDLDALGIKFDVFTSERALVEAGAVEKALKFLEERDLVYTGQLDPPKGKKPEDWEPRPQTLFRATAFGDDVDRPLCKSDGTWTYFATDIAYHLDKAQRGFATMIDVWGADHAGYVKRMQAAVKAVTEGRGVLDVKLCQMVNLLDAGQPAMVLITPSSSASVKRPNGAVARVGDSSRSGGNISAACRITEAPRAWAYWT